MKTISVILLFTVFSCQSKEKTQIILMNQENKKIEVATLAGGCFWCTEAIFLELNGVEKVVPGYTGGSTKNPDYKEICTGTTGHAEAIEITFDANKISFQELLEIFFATHDPTTLNRQGADVGTQYRSEIFYHSEEQKNSAEEYISFLDKSKVFKNPVVTQISQAPIFYEAEDYHKNYYQRNKEQSYCSYVILPKMNKLQKNFQSKLKK